MAVAVAQCSAGQGRQRVASAGGSVLSCGSGTPRFICCVGSSSGSSEAGWEVQYCHVVRVLRDSPAVLAVAVAVVGLAGRFSTVMWLGYSTIHAAFYCGWQ